MIYDVGYWETIDGDLLKIEEMGTSHIVNCINCLEKRMPEEEEDEHIVADHWSIPGCCIIPGAESFMKKINEFENELYRRLNDDYKSLI